jgi:hypothetical protein
LFLDHGGTLAVWFLITAGVVVLLLIVTVTLVVLFAGDERAKRALEALRVLCDAFFRSSR